MRLKAVAVENIGGLVDQRVELPDQPFVAFAGPNGTGKTKLLAAMIGYWINNIPTPRHGMTASATAEIELTEEERAALAQLQVQMGWAQEPPTLPELVKLTTTRSDVAGVRPTSDPNLTVMTQFQNNAVFLQQNPSLNPMYLPAERRLLPTGGASIDLAQLADAMAFAQTQQSRASVQNYGRLDDQEFEQFAKALCVAHSLPEGPSEEAETVLSRVQWPEFQETVNELLHPKELLPLTRAHPDQLRIKLPNGDTHYVPDLSSGERQALVIISRVLRAGAGHSSVVLVDEPDAYLHPNLSQRLLQALERGTGDFGQLIVATHSPAILDRIPPNSIFRLDYGKPASPLADESGLIELYRTTGFRASALTQSELLVVSEGDLDDVVLKALFPKLARASVQQGQGRVGVLQRVRQLIGYQIPVLGMVDHDVEPPEIEPALQPHVHILPTADLEGAFLSDDAALQIIVDHGFAKQSYRSINALKTERDQMFLSKRDNTIAELAQSELRKQFGIKWPASRGDNPIDRLRGVSSQASNPSAAEIEEAIQNATARWNAAQAEPWTIVRGKYILNEFTDKCTDWAKGSSLLEAIAKQKPSLSALGGLEQAIDRLLA